ncbi:MAG: hypothetical protein JJU36_13165 [Phycisphaeraceae bacterium]|nr:hypothetical protein [Phycisphaeraceae bacterium]
MSPIIAQAQTSGYGSWLLDAVFSGPVLGLTGLLILCIAGLGGCMVVLFRLGRAGAGVKTQKPHESVPATSAGVEGEQSIQPALNARLNRKMRANEGTAMIEFALVLPFAMFFILMITQLMLLISGRLFVHYASFAAARAAVVQIGDDYTFQGVGGEPQNEIVLHMGSPKYRSIQEAAALALWPVSGPGGGDAGAMGDLINRLDGFYRSFGHETPGYVRNVLPGRLSYALNNTEVVIHRPVAQGPDVRFVPQSGIAEFGPREAITVEVRHRFFLSMPMVGHFFRDGPADTTVGGSYTMIQAQTTLTNEGIITALPPRPELDRAP